MAWPCSCSWPFVCIHVAARLPLGCILTFWRRGNVTSRRVLPHTSNFRFSEPIPRFRHQPHPPLRHCFSPDKRRSSLSPPPNFSRSLGHCNQKLHAQNHGKRGGFCMGVGVGKGGLWVRVGGFCGFGYLFRRHISTFTFAVAAVCGSSCFWWDSIIYFPFDLKLD